MAYQSSSPQFSRNRIRATPLAKQSSVGPIEVVKAKKMPAKLKIQLFLGLVSLLFGGLVVLVSSARLHQTFSGITEQTKDVVSSIDDSNRVFDIAMIDNELLAYQAKVGTFPSVQQLGNADWRQVNMPNLSSNFLTSQDEASPVLSTKPHPTNYWYIAHGNRGECEGTQEDPCTTFTVGARLSTGKDEVKSYTP